MGRVLPTLTILVAIAVSLALVAYPAARICRRLGFPPALGLLAVVPVVNLLLLWFVAMTAWPADREGRRG
jgi:predicted PurR-regulated permease PerM